MKRLITVAALMLGVTALTAGTDVPADAKVPPAPRSSAGHGGALLPLRPGRHEVKVRIPLSASPAGHGRAVVPATTRAVSPRVNCGGFNGNIEWGGNGSVLDPAYLDVWGEVWSTCNSSTYLYLSYQLLTSPHNVEVGRAGAYSTVGVNWQDDSEWAPYGYISIDACSNYNGWSCGAPIHV